MTARLLIIGIQLIGTLLIVAALTSGFFVIVALTLAVIFSPIQSVAAAFAHGGLRFVAFAFAALPSLLMALALHQRQGWIEECRAAGCSGLADSAINAVPWLAAATFVPLTLCASTMVWNGLGSGSHLSGSARAIIIVAAFAPVALIYGARVV